MAEVTAIGNGAFRITDGSRTRLAYAAVAADRCWVFLDGRVYVLDVEEGSPEGLPHTIGSHDGTPKGLPYTIRALEGSPKGLPYRRKKRGDDHGALAAPMPATVVKIIVEPGQRVSKGDVLIMLEAMKMELPIKAPRDASVKSIACRPGELVQPGVPLLELE